VGAADTTGAPSPGGADALTTGDDSGGTTSGGDVTGGVSGGAGVDGEEHAEQTIDQTSAWKAPRRDMPFD
jgi:hypothetical protein